MPADPKLKPLDAAKELGVSEKTLRNWRSLGTGPQFVKVGGAVRYRQSALDRFVAERTYQRTQPRRRAS